MAETTNVNALYKRYSCIAIDDRGHTVSLEADRLSALARVLKERLLYNPTVYPCRIMFSWNRLRGGRVDRHVELGSDAQVKDYLHDLWSAYLCVEVDESKFFIKTK